MPPQLAPGTAGRRLISALPCGRERDLASLEVVHEMYASAIHTFMQSKPQDSSEADDFERKLWRYMPWSSLPCDHPILLGMETQCIAFIEHVLFATALAVIDGHGEEVPNYVSNSSLIARIKWVIQGRRQSTEPGISHKFLPFIETKHGPRFRARNTLSPLPCNQYITSPEGIRNYFCQRNCPHKKPKDAKRETGHPSLRSLYRATMFARDILVTMCEKTYYAGDILRIDVAEHVVSVLHGPWRPLSLRGASLFRPFRRDVFESTDPDIGAAVATQRLVPGRLWQNSGIRLLITELIQKLAATEKGFRHISGSCCLVKNADFSMVATLPEKTRAVPAASHEFFWSMLLRKDVLRLHYETGPDIVVDFTNMQYGWSEPVLDWESYLRSRYHRILERDDDILTDERFVEDVEIREDQGMPVIRAAEKVRNRLIRRTMGAMATWLEEHDTDVVNLFNQTDAEFAVSKATLRAFMMNAMDEELTRYNDAGLYRLYMDDQGATQVTTTSTEATKLGLIWLSEDEFEQARKVNKLCSDDQMIRFWMERAKKHHNVLAGIVFRPFTSGYYPCYDFRGPEHPAYLSQDWAREAAPYRDNEAPETPGSPSTLKDDEDTVSYHESNRLPGISTPGLEPSLAHDDSVSLPSLSSQLPEFFAADEHPASPHNPLGDDREKTSNRNPSSMTRTTQTGEEHSHTVEPDCPPSPPREETCDPNHHDPRQRLSTLQDDAGDSALRQAAGALLALFQGDGCDAAHYSIDSLPSLGPEDNGDCTQHRSDRSQGPLPSDEENIVCNTSDDLPSLTEENEEGSTYHETECWPGSLQDEGDAFSNAFGEKDDEASADRDSYPGPDCYYASPSPSGEEDEGDTAPYGPFYKSCRVRYDEGGYFFRDAACSPTLPPYLSSILLKDGKSFDDKESSLSPSLSRDDERTSLLQDLDGPPYPRRLDGREGLAQSEPSAEE